MIKIVAASSLNDSIKKLDELDRERLADTVYTYPGLNLVLLNLPQRLTTRGWFVRRSAVKLVSPLLLKSVVGHCSGIN